MLLLCGLISGLSVNTRLTKLYRWNCRGSMPETARIKAESWLCKKFCVLCKRKHARKQRPRDPDFRYLLSLLDQDSFWLLFLQRVRLASNASNFGDVKASAIPFQGC